MARLIFCRITIPLWMFEDSGGHELSCVKQIKESNCHRFIEITLTLTWIRLWTLDFGLPPFVQAHRWLPRSVPIWRAF
jgi:hypothetical protein